MYTTDCYILALFFYYSTLRQRGCSIWRLYALVTLLVKCIQIFTAWSFLFYRGSGHWGKHPLATTRKLQMLRLTCFCGRKNMALYRNESAMMPCDMKGALQLVVTTWMKGSLRLAITTRMNFMFNVHPQRRGGEGGGEVKKSRLHRRLRRGKHPFPSP